MRLVWWGADEASASCPRMPQFPPRKVLFFFAQFLIFSADEHFCSLPLFFKNAACSDLV